MSETNQTTGVSKSASLDRGSVNVKLGEILSCCHDYERAIRYSNIPSLELLELVEKYYDHLAMTMNYERTKTFGTEDFATFNRFYTSFMAFHRENVERFSERLQHHEVKGSKTLEILNNLLDDGRIVKPEMRAAKVEPIPLQDLAQAREDMRTAMDKIVKRCTGFLQKIEKHAPNATFILIMTRHDSFFGWAIKCKKLDFDVHVYRDAMQLWHNFKIFHDKVMKDHPNLYPESLPTA